MTTVKIDPSPFLYGETAAVASKSVAHRMLILAAFADKETVLNIHPLNDDLTATMNCIEALGAKIEKNPPFYKIFPIKNPVFSPILPCKESGSTLRFLLPIVSFLSLNATFLLEGRLSKRPLSPLKEELLQKGIRFSFEEENRFSVSGSPENSFFTLPGNVSSQFISGLAMAFALSSKGGTVRISGTEESRHYVDVTLDVLSKFGIQTTFENGILSVKEGQKIQSAGAYTVEGDWSNAAFPLCMGALSPKGVTVSNLNLDSRQGDKEILTLLEQFGAKVERLPDALRVSNVRPLHGISVDCAQIPDLVPPLAALAAFATGKTRFYNAERLRLKESDRLKSLFLLLSSFSVKVQEEKDALLVEGTPLLKGQVAEPAKDHRIIMSAALLALFSQSPSLIRNTEAVSKSQKDFFTVLKRDLHAHITVETKEPS